MIKTKAFSYTETSMKIMVLQNITTLKFSE